MKLKRKRYHQYRGKVYDLEVSTSDHSYIINNVVVHNSAAGSIVAYLMNITKIDPISYGLLFERFLNEGRIGKEVSEEFVILNDKLRLEKEKGVRVYRDSQEIQVLVKEIQEGDDLILDSI